MGYDFVDPGVAWAAVVEPPELSPLYLQCLLDALTAIDLIWLKANPDTPRLYKAGVRYVREPKGQERWRSVPYVLQAKQGDCEDLACWLAAEEQLRGVNARAVGKGIRTKRGALFHITVRYPDGRIDDPSKRLGMSRKAKY